MYIIKAGTDLAHINFTLPPTNRMSSRGTLFSTTHIQLPNTDMSVCLLAFQQTDKTGSWNPASFWPLTR